MWHVPPHDHHQAGQLQPSLCPEAHVGISDLTGVLWPTCRLEFNLATIAPMEDDEIADRHAHDGQQDKECQDWDSHTCRATSAGSGSEHVHRVFGEARHKDTASKIDGRWPDQRLREWEEGGWLFRLLCLLLCHPSLPPCSRRQLGGRVLLDEAIVLPVHHVPPQKDHDQLQSNGDQHRQDQRDPHIEQTDELRRESASARLTIHFYFLSISASGHRLAHIRSCVNREAARGYFCVQRVAGVAAVRVAL